MLPALCSCMQFENHHVEALEESDYFELGAYHPKSGEVIAYLSYLIPLSSRDVYVKRLIVHPKFKGRGIARLMMEELIKRHSRYKIHWANVTYIERTGLRKLKYRIKSKWLKFIKWLNPASR